MSRTYASEFVACVSPPRPRLRCRPVPLCHSSNASRASACLKAQAGFLSACRYGKMKGVQEAAEQQEVQEKTVETARQIQEAYMSFRASDEDHTQASENTDRA